MPNKSTQDHLNDVDRILDEVREMLMLSDEANDIGELTALQMLLKVTKELHYIDDVTDLITKVLDSAIAFVDADRAFMMLLDEESGEPRFKMGRTSDGQYLTVEDFSPSTSILERVLDTGKTIIVPDAINDAIYSKQHSIQNLSLRTILCSPLMIKQEIIGLLYVDSSRKPLKAYSKAHINVLASLADQSTVAIRNAQKFETHVD